jgi:hypothetical protein
MPAPETSGLISDATVFLPAANFSLTMPSPQFRYDGIIHLLASL